MSSALFDSVTRIARHEAGARSIAAIGVVADTFDGAAERLDHLVALGVDAVELMPVAAFPGERGWGYDGVALYAANVTDSIEAGIARARAALASGAAKAKLEQFATAAHRLGAEAAA